MDDGLRWKRVLLKVSGEALSGGGDAAISREGVHALAREIAAAHASGVQIAVVNGGGNVLRGGQLAVEGIQRPTADRMGMLATLINGLALGDVLESHGVPTRVFNAFDVASVAEPFVWKRVLRQLEKGRVVILAGGTGHPFFTTDTTAALRAVEIGADVLLKGTKVDGVYDRDPKVHTDAVRFAALTFEEALERRLQVMDRTAFTLCVENDLPVVVFDMGVEGNLSRVLRGEDVGTIVQARAR